MFRPLNRAGAAFVAAGLVCVQAALANVTVRFDPLSTTVPVGGTFTVNIVADIPQPAGIGIPDGTVSRRDSRHSQVA